MLRKTFTITLLSLCCFSCMKKADYREIPVTLCSIDVQPLDNTGSSPQTTTSDTVAAQAFGLRLLLNYMDEAGICQINPMETVSFFPGCYAMGNNGKTSYYYVPENPIDSLFIYSTEDFDASHPAGTDLTAFFSIFKSYSYFLPMDYLGGERRILFENMALQPKREEVNLLLMKQPENSGNHQFTIRIYTRNGELFQQTLPSITLNL